MDLQEFFIGFEDCCVGYIRDDFEYFSLQAKLPHMQDKVFEFNLEEKTEICLRVHNRYQ